MKAVEELARDVGAVRACQSLAVPRASYYRRRSAKSANEPGRSRRRSPRALSRQERQQVLDLLHSERFVDKAPQEVYASLLDEGTYLCSVRSMYRILDQAREVRERRNQLRHPCYKKPELLATGPNQVWSWDITKLLGPAKGTYFHLYVILDIFSRYVVGWMVASRESAPLAQRLIRETLEKQQVPRDQLTIHSDRGPSMKSQSVAQLLATLAVVKSHSRPHVSNDNPFSESQFKTLKYAGGILFCPRVALETSRKNQLEPDISKWQCHTDLISPIALALKKTPAGSVEPSSAGTTTSTITQGSLC